MVSETEIRLVIERLRTNPSNVKLSIGKMGTFDKDQLINEVQNQTEIGKLVIEMHLKYLRSFKKM